MAYVEPTGLPVDATAPALRDALSGRVLSLTKVVLLGPRTAPAYLRRLAAKIEAAAGAKVDLCHAALGVQGAAGTMACAVDTAIADGVVTEAEERAVETALLSIEAKVAAVRVSLRQHRDRRGAR